METSNEELKSANEELQSTNEELQSTNEELETSKEETQSLNEELITVNTELQGKIDEVSKANDDMRNFLDSTEVATIFLDNDMCIKGFSSHASKVINVIEADVGRPIHHIVSNLKYERLVEDAKEVLRTLVFEEKEVQTKDGHWYLMRIMPYRTIANVIDGVVITFLDIHEQITVKKKLKESERAVQEARKYAENIVDTVREPLVVLDGDLRVVSASRSFYKIFKAKPEETEGQLIYDLVNRQWDIPKLRELLEDILPKKTTFEGFEVEHEFPSIGQRTMCLNARQIQREAGKPQLILLAIEDITERKQLAEKEKEEFLKAIEIAKEAINITSPDGIMIYTNDAMDELFGYKKGELIGKSASILNASATPEAVMKKIMEKIKKKGHWEGEIHNKRKDSREFTSYAAISAVKDKDGKILNFVSTQHGITSRSK